MLLKKVFKTGTIQFCGLLIGLFGSIYLANLLGPAELGVFSAYVAAASLLSIPVQKPLQTLTLKELSKSETNSNKAAHNGYIAFSVIFLISYSLIVITLLQIFASFTPLEVGFLTTFVLAVGLLSFTTGFLRFRDQLVLATFPESLLRPVVFLSSVFIISEVFAVEFGEKSFYFYVFSFVVVTLIYAPVIAPRLRHLDEINLEWRLKERIGRLAELSIFSGSKVLESQLSILLLAYFIGSVEVGYYKVAATGSSLVAFGALVVNFVISRKLAFMEYAKDRVLLQGLLARSGLLTFMLTMPLACLAFLFASDLVQIFFGDSYQESVNILRSLIVLQAANVLFGPVVVLLNLGGHTKVVMVAGILSASVNLISSFVLIPSIGVWGGVFAYGLSLVFWNFYLFFYVYTKLSVNPSILAGLSKFR